MFNKFTGYLRLNRDPIPNFFEFPANKQKKILKQALREANKEQHSLIERFDELQRGRKAN